VITRDQMIDSVENPIFKILLDEYKNLSK